MADDDDDSIDSSDDSPNEFRSRLSHGRTRFLAHVVEHGLETGRQTPGDFIRHFPPEVIMEGLRNRPELRARILTPTTGIKHKIAVKKSPESAGDDLTLAILEGEATAENVVTLFHPDDRVRYLDHHRLWAFVAEGDFWRHDDGIEFEIAKSHVAYILDRAVEDGLMNHQEVVEGISIIKLTELLPRAELGWILQAALDRGRDKKPFTDEDLLREAPISVLTEHIPLSVLWESVVTPFIADAHDLIETVSVDDVEDDEEPTGEQPREGTEADFDFSDEPTMNGKLDAEVDQVVEAAISAAIDGD